MAQPGARNDEADCHQRQQGGAETGTRPGNRRERRIRCGAGDPGDGESREGGQPAHPSGHRTSRRPRSARWRPRARWPARRTAPRARFATTPTTDTELCSSTITGAHISCAATGNGEGRSPTADPRREHPADGGSPRPGEEQQPQGRQGRQGEARGTGQPRVPDQQDEDGHREGGKSRRGAARCSGRAARPRPSRPRGRRSAPAGRGRRTASSSTAASGGRQRRRRPSSPARPSAAASTMATLLPLTADRWVIPVTSMASSRSWGVREVSPITSPGSSPRASVGSPSVASANRSRTTSAARATHPGSARSVGGPRGTRTATTSSAPS